jgi:hypothetical protein
MTVTSKPSSGEPVIETRSDPIRGIEYICTTEFWNFLDELVEAVNAAVADVADESIATNAGTVLGLIQQRMDEFQPPSINMGDVLSQVRQIVDELDSPHCREMKRLRSSTIAAGATTFTTTGDEYITCLNTAAAVITMNPFPDDGEDVIIAMRNAQITANGPINGGSTLIVPNQYDTAHLKYSLDAGEWAIV